MNRSPLALIWSFLLIAGCGGNAPDTTVPLRRDLAVYHRAVSTSSDAAQKYFDQGMILYYGFNHDAAIASFARAAELDPSLAMAWWGQALSYGPNINNGQMDSTAAKAAWDAARRAASLAAHASPTEQELIRALSARYSWPPREERKSLDLAYADSMRRVWTNHKDDPDIGVLFADAMLNLRPWDLWTSGGQPQPGTPEIVSTLEAVLAKAPGHPGACHFYIHTMEASPDPARALAAADTLRYKVPGAGHLLHMPSHIDIRIGHYENAVLANLRGISVDSSWTSQGGFYTLYRAHNFHFLAYAAMFDGQRELGLQAARGMVEQVPLEMVRAYIDFMDAYLSVPVHVMVRFGMWEELLQEHAPPDDLLATTAFWHYGRTVAFAALGRVTEGTQELSAFRQSVKDLPESRLLGNNSAKTVLRVGLSMAEGELEYRKGHHARAFSLLRLAVQRDDSLRYDEPWGWMMPVRHSLGALLLEQGRLNDAEQVYLEDLRIHPNNGWALKGLAECYHRTGHHHQAMETETLFRTAWARSDIDLKASCFCRTGEE